MFTKALRFSLFAVAGNIAAALKTLEAVEIHAAIDRIPLVHQPAETLPENLLREKLLQRHRLVRVLRKASKFTGWALSDFNFRGFLLRAVVPLREPSKPAAAIAVRLAECFQSWEQNEALPLVTLSVTVNREAVMASATVAYRVQSVAVAVARSRARLRAARAGRRKPADSFSADFPSGVPHGTESSPRVGLNAHQSPFSSQQQRLQSVGFSFGYKFYPLTGVGKFTRSAFVSYLPLVSYLWRESGIGQLAGHVFAAVRTLIGFLIRSEEIKDDDEHEGEAKTNEATKTSSSGQGIRLPSQLLQILPPWMQVWAETWAEGCAEACQSKTLQVGPVLGVNQDGPVTNCLISASPFYLVARKARRRLAHAAVPAAASPVPSALRTDDSKTEPPAMAAPVSSRRVLDVLAAEPAVSEATSPSSIERMEELAEPNLVQSNSANFSSRAPSNTTTAELLPG